MTSLLPGFLTMASLIVAIGAQNAYVLRIGLTRRHVGLVVAVCALSDAVLVVAGVLGVGRLVTAHPALLIWVRWVGAAYLVGFGITCLWRARRPSTLVASAAVGTRGSVLATVLALTWLNPHVYLDTVLLVGSLANQHGPTGRWWFTAGAALASCVWFAGLGYGARVLAPLFARPGTWRVLDVVIGLVMFVIAAALLLG
ncbi:L-lysine exporter family protein LysE/ArgO [Humibacillus xanthopallidus]|uniref:L-lysine exporter family protein LysE/ArgO n=1 Tax=Humibacillus xanthopallidus TaxID=412689 RepID=A0A543PKZ7_9MICO|nr:LysE/ArgO family amino acid transporter [Humibacillus xanthopallidus]TQN44756.1 L-lysine exporter family protein LysE/ArgO [Humibacillus xanthopallidus]